MAAEKKTKTEILSLVWGQKSPVKVAAGGPGLDPNRAGGMSTGAGSLLRGELKGKAATGKDLVSRMELSTSYGVAPPKGSAWFNG